MSEYAPGAQIDFAVTSRLSTGQIVETTNSEVVFISPVGGVSVVPLTELAPGMYATTWTIPTATLPGTYGFYYQGTYNVGNGPQSFISDLNEFDVVPGWAATEAGAAGLYCTAGDIRRRLAWLTTTVMSDDVIVQDHILPAMAEIDAALGGRYTVPFSSVPPMIVTIARDLASASAANLTHQGDGTAEEVPLSVRLRGWGMGKLNALRDGTTRLPGVPQNVRVLSSTYDPQGQESPLQRFNLYREPRGNDIERSAAIVWPNGIW